MSSSNCCFLTCIQVPQEAGQVVWYSHLFQNFPQFIVIHGEDDGTPLQYSCLENPMDGGAWCRLLSMGSQRVGHDWATSLTCLLRNLYAGQEATVRTGHGTTDWLQIGKGVRQGCILPPCLFNLYAEYIMWNARLHESHLESRLPGEISVTSDVQMTPPLWQKAKKN